MVFISIAIAVLVGIIIFKGIHLVPQSQNWLVERFGKYEKTLNPGLNLINPLFAKISAKIDIREQVLDLPAQGIITEDNAAVTVDGVVFYKITDPFRAFYGIQNIRLAIENLAMTSLRSIMGKLTLDNSLSSREKINADLLEVLDAATDAWGTKITRVEIKDIQPPEDLQKAMAMQMKAERERRATVLEAEAQREAAEKKAEGFKRAQILEAEARKIAAEMDAEARERLALAESRAIESVSHTLKQSGGDPVTYLLGIEYIKGLTKLAQSEGSRIIVLPADLLETVKNLFKANR
ncbi:MAG: stomatin-like protein [Termitinemataceae bacterium]